MTRTLFIIAGASLVLCLACLGGAGALASHDLSRKDCTWTFTDYDGNDDRPEFGCGPVSPSVTRTLAWNGTDTLTSDVSMDITYVQGPTAGVTITGPKAVVDRIRLVDGRLTIADSDVEARGFVRAGRGGIRVWSEDEMVKITVTAPNVTKFHTEASGDIRVDGYDQPTLGILIDGSGDVEVDGKARQLDLRSNASGDADLEGLLVTDATIDSTGSGDVTVGPTGAAAIDLSGSGDVDLTRRPASVSKNLSGSGDVNGE